MLLRPSSTQRLEQMAKGPRPRVFLGVVGTFIPVLFSPIPLMWAAGGSSKLSWAGLSTQSQQRGGDGANRTHLRFSRCPGPDGSAPSWGQLCRAGLRTTTRPHLEAGPHLRLPHLDWPRFYASSPGGTFPHRCPSGSTFLAWVGFHFDQFQRSEQNCWCVIDVRSCASIYLPGETELSYGAGSPWGSCTPKCPLWLRRIPVEHFFGHLVFPKLGGSR